MFLKYLFRTLIILFLSLSPAIAQTDACSPDLAQVIATLEQAQSEFDTGNTDSGLALVGDARSALALEEATCFNYAPDTVGDKRTNPVPLGERKQFDLVNGGKASVVVTGFIDNANEFSEVDIEDDERLIGVEITYFCESSPDETCVVDTLSLPSKVVGNSNIESESPRASSLPNTDNVTLYGGGQVDHTMAFLVGKDESDFVLRIGNQSPIYFTVS